MKKKLAGAVVAASAVVTIATHDARPKWARIRPGSCAVTLPDGGVRTPQTNDARECLGGEVVNKQHNL